MPKFSLKNIFKKSPFLASSAIILMLGVVIVIGSFTLSKITETRPPFFKIDTKMAFLGIEGFGAYSFSDEDFQNFEENEVKYVNPKGQRIFYSEKDLSVRDILNLVKPEENLQIVFYYYNNQIQDFIVFPRYEGKNDFFLDHESIKTHILPKFTPFYIYANRDFSVSDLKPFYILMNENVKLYLNDFTKGWHLLMHPNLEELYLTCSNRIENIFVLDTLIGNNNNFISKILNKSTSFDLSNSKNALSAQDGSVYHFKEFFTILDLKESIKPYVGNIFWLKIIGREGSCRKN